MNEWTDMQDEVARLNRERRMGYPRQPEPTPPAMVAPDQEVSAPEFTGPARAETPPVAPEPPLPPQIRSVLFSGNRGVLDTTVGMVELTQEEASQIAVVGLRALARGFRQTLDAVAQIHELKALKRPGLDSTVADIERRATDGPGNNGDGQGRP